MVFVFIAGLVALNFVMATYQVRKLQEVHVLVNSRLSLALEEISELKRVVSAQQSKLDRSRG
jgi:hypothetical protein